MWDYAAISFILEQASRGNSENGSVWFLHTGDIFDGPGLYCLLLACFELQYITNKNRTLTLLLRRFVGVGKL